MGRLLRWARIPSRRRRLAHRFWAQLVEDRLQGADTRRQRIAVVCDGAGQKGGERGGFVFGKVKVLHGLRYWFAVALAKVVDLAPCSSLLLTADRGSTSIFPRHDTRDRHLACR
jgi:hypothetical protein